MAFSIITDSAANLTNEIILKNDIGVIPMPYFYDGNEYSCSNIDEFNDKEYYDMMKSGTVVTTSQIWPQRYIDYMEPVLKEGKDILFVGISSGISGAFSSAQTARQELLEKYPEREIRLVDSLGASLGEGLLVIRAAKCRDNLMSLSETAERIKKLRHCIYQVFIVDDLKYLNRTGRLSNISALVGSLLEIRPILKGNAEGKIVATKKVRGKKRAIKEMAQRYASLVKDTQLVGISYSACREDAEYLAELLKKQSSPKEILLVKHEPATGSHLGPGSLALYFEGAEDVRDY